MDRDARAADYPGAFEGSDSQTWPLRRPAGVHQSVPRRQQLACDPQRSQESCLRRLADRGDGVALQVCLGSAILRYRRGDAAFDRRSSIAVRTMTISRREFVESTVVSLAGSSLLGPAAWSLTSSQIAGSSLVFDLGPHCILRESLQGFLLPSVGQVTTRLYPASLERPQDCRMLIVPGAGAFPSTLFPVLLDFVSAGGIL